MAQIKTYARLKPSKRPYPGYEIANNVLTVHIPDSKDFLIQGYQQPIRSNISYDIIFTDIFRPEATQEDVFEGVAKDIIQNFLNGYNGTIFAYGQTGTGKTYTVEGNSNGYNARGLATRALSLIYQQLSKRTDEHISVYISYLEIYQEVAYDLLNAASRSSSLPMAPLAKVTVVEGPRGSCILRGLSLHLAANEEIAQMLLYQGQANRKVAETPVNQRSSRSHAVFTVYLQVRKHESEVLVNSKLHLVDLAGSERVSKTGVDGQQLTEAKSINLSLHHLETVIIALQSDRTNTPSNTTAGDKSKGDNLPTASRSTSFTSGPSSEGNRPVKFVPYRNSLLTMVLKDSLGGNCLTAMIATISLEPENLGESISTCRFAQRVARIANNARRNEEIDDKTLIRRLKHKVADLENQVAFLRSKGKPEPISNNYLLGSLTEEDRVVCAKIMEGFLQGEIPDPVDAGICDHCRFRECLHLLKHQCLQIGNVVWPPKLPTQQAQPGRQSPADRAEAVLPNNPNRDSGDHVMNTTSQGTSPTAPTNIVLPGSTSLKNSCEAPHQSPSEATIHSSDDYLLDNQEIGQAEGGIFLGMNKGGCSTLACAKGEKSYEWKNDVDVTKSVKRVVKPGEEQLSKLDPQDLIKLDPLIKELAITHNNIKLKLLVAERELDAQHVYLTELRLRQADPEVIAKQTLVEKHLLKRQEKLRNKLTNVLIQKNKLEVLRRESGLCCPVSGTSSRVSVEEFSAGTKQTIGPANSKQVYECLRNENKTNKDAKAEMNSSLEVPFIKEIDKMESNQSSLYHPMRLNYDCETDSFLHPVAEDRNGSRSRDVVFSSASDVDASEMHVKRLQEYLDQVLNVTFIDKLASDRHCDGRPNRSYYVTGQSQTSNNPLCNAAGTQDNNISPGYDGVMPTEVKSLHDPRHSHKFAMDDRPYESSSLVTPEKNNIETLYSIRNLNNSTDAWSVSSKSSKSGSKKYSSKSRDSSTKNYNNSNNCNFQPLPSLPSYLQICVNRSLLNPFSSLEFNIKAFPSSAEVFPESLCLQQSLICPSPQQRGEELAQNKVIKKLFPTQTAETLHLNSIKGNHQTNSRNRFHDFSRQLSPCLYICSKTDAEKLHKIRHLLASLTLDSYPQLMLNYTNSIRLEVNVVSKACEGITFLLLSDARSKFIELGKSRTEDCSSGYFLSETKFPLRKTCDNKDVPSDRSPLLKGEHSHFRHISVSPCPITGSLKAHLMFFASENSVPQHEDSHLKFTLAEERRVKRTVGQAAQTIQRQWRKFRFRQ
ncbi:uncharacterized protein LOC106053636 isoform X2 [Biomphalaria glabrata]|uniref:Uncharacterized protein LOC106053636 isoform X2 n=1 Tax=Biomphalaria glabrata TaxID=6526 RepID=A0A9W3BM37_BIOGL|nr:uncharacterized protein LOC106053636 isoform X2 [Biomphalaria glabrata]